MNSPKGLAFTLSQFPNHKKNYHKLWLEMVSYDVQAIGKTYHDVGDCFTEMLSHWIIKHSTSPPSWKQLVEALGSSSIKREDIGREVKSRWSES